MGTATNLKIADMQKALDVFEKGFKDAMKKMTQGDNEADHKNMGAARGAVVKDQKQEAARLAKQAKTAILFRSEFDKVRRPLEKELEDLKKFKKEKEQKLLAKVTAQKESFKKIDDYIVLLDAAVKKCSEAVTKFAGESDERAKLTKSFDAFFDPAQRAGASAGAASKDVDDD